MIDRKSPLAQAFWQDGPQKDCPVIDMHAHHFDFYGGYIPYDTTDKVLAAMDRSHTVLSCLVSHRSLFAPQVGIDADLALARLHPDRFKLYHIVPSRRLDPKADLARVKQNASHYVGFKFLSDYYQVPLSDARHQPYFQFAQDNGLFCLCHTWGGSAYDGPAEVEKVLQAYPDLILIAGHSIHGDWDAAVRLARAYPHLMLELTAVLGQRGVVELFAKNVGSDRMLFGVDMPWFSYEFGIGSVLAAEISDAQKRDILYRNAGALLSRFPWYASLPNRPSD